MTELSVSSPAMARLFEEVDLASVPLSSIGRQTRMWWQSQCHGRLMPLASGLIQYMPAALVPFGFLFTIDEATGDYLLHWAGPVISPLFSTKGAGTNLASFDDRRLAARLRLALNFVKSRKEPLTVRFATRLLNQEKGDAELFIAPAQMESTGKLAFFGSFAFRLEQHGW